MEKPSEEFDPSEEVVDPLVDSESSQTEEQDSDDSGRPAFWPRGLGKSVGGQPPFLIFQGGHWGPSTCRWGTRSCRQINSQYGLLDPAVGDAGSLCSSGWPITLDVNQRCGQVSVFSFVAAFFVQHRNPFCLVETGFHYCTGYIRWNS